jgi:ketosteroid isomerase-like protein
MSSEVHERELRALEAQRGAALIAKDWRALHSLLAADLLHIHANGSVEDRESYLTTMQTKFDVIRIERADLQIRMHGEVGVMTGSLVQDIRILHSNALITLIAVTTQVWVRRDTRWELLTFQATKVG